MKKIIAFAIFLLASPIAALAATSFSFGISIGGGTGVGGGAWNPGALSATGLPTGSIMGIIGGIMYWLLGILGVFGVIGFVISGILYLVSTGDEAMIDRAKEAMKWSIVGVIVGLIGVVVIQAVGNMLNAYSGF